MGVGETNPRHSIIALRSARLHSSLVTCIVRFRLKTTLARVQLWTQDTRLAEGGLNLDLEEGQFSNKMSLVGLSSSNRNKGDFISKTVITLVF